MEALEKAAKAVGNKRRLALALGIKAQSIQSWKGKVPAARVLQIERVSGVPRTELRPDLYPE